MLSRRNFIRSSFQTAIAGSTSSLAAFKTFANTENKKNLATLDIDIINCVKKLHVNRDLSLTILYPEGCLPNLQPAMDRFTQETGVKFILKETGVDDINSNIIFNNTQKKHFFDIALPATFGIPDLVSARALRPLDDFVQKYEPSDYQDQQLYNYGDFVNDQFYGYQTDGDTYLMFYNQTMMDDANEKNAFFEQYGYPLAIPQTWNQLDDMIRFFHRPKKQQYGGCLFRIPGYGAWEWWSRFHAKGFFPFDKNLRPQINNEAGVTALQEMIDISPYLHPNTAADGLFANWETFSKGNTFCNIGWGGSQKFFNGEKSAIKGKLYYAPAPGGTIKGQIIPCPIFNWGWNYVVSSQCSEPEIAYLFTLFACSPVMSTISVQQNGFFDPFREEHYTDPAIERTYSRAFLQAHKTSMKESIPDFYMPLQSSYLSSLQENIALAIKGDIPAQKAMDLTASQWKLITVRGGIEKQQQAWEFLKAKYPKALRENLS